MGAVIGKAADSLGGVVGNAVVAPFKNIFSGSCEGVCSGRLDLICFIEHLCVVDLVKLFMILGLSYITLLFFYLLFKLGICQCITKSLCRICWAACETYWFTLEDVNCFLWHKLKNTKRVNRRRKRQGDIEVGYSSSPESELYSGNHHPTIGASRKRKSCREKRRKELRRTLRSLSRRGMRQRGREMSSRVKVGSGRLKSSKKIRLRKTRKLRGRGRVSKRRKLG